MMRPAFFVLVVAACAFILAPSVSRAVTVEVFPGNGTLQSCDHGGPRGRARLTLHPGVYNGAVVVRNGSRSRCLHTASNDGGCLIDAQCAAAIAFDASPPTKVNLENVEEEDSRCHRRAARDRPRHLDRHPHRRQEHRQAVSGSRS